MDLNLAMMDIILANFARKCQNCETWMQPHSTKCVRCGNVEPFVKVFVPSYFEHFVQLKCKVHEEGTFHFCMHPRNDSELEELRTWCVRCIMDEVAKKGGVEIITKPTAGQSDVKIEVE